MSHIVEIQTEVRDVAAIRHACERLKLGPPVEGRFELFTQTVSGWAVSLPDWKYPVVCDVGHGKIQFDNFDGRWGNRTELDRFLQRYAVEKASLEARKKACSVTEQSLPDGSIKLTINTGA